MKDERELRVSLSSFILPPSSLDPYASSSIGRAAVSKAAGCRFDSYLACSDRQAAVQWGGGGAGEKPRAAEVRRPLGQAAFVLAPPAGW